MQQQRGDWEQQRQMAEADLERQRAELEHPAKDLRDRSRRESEQDKARLQEQREAFEQQRQMVEQDLERQRQEMERQARDSRSKGGDEKETRALRQSVQEQKTAIFELQGQLSREQTLSTFLTPGEYIKMAKREEAELGLSAHEISTLKLRLAGLETETKTAKWHNEAMRKHLPTAAHEAVAKELNQREPVQVCA
jgi:hypothetical protein